MHNYAKHMDWLYGSLNRKYIATFQGKNEEETAKDGPPDIISA